MPWNDQKPKNKNIILVTMTMVVLVVLVILLYRNFFKDKDQEELTEVDSRQKEEEIPEVTFPLDFLEDPEFIRLKDPGDGPFISQQEAVSYLSRPLPPHEIQVLDLGIGQNLVITWLWPDEPEVEKIRIFRSSKAGQLKEVRAEVFFPKTSFRDTNLINNNKYYYTLKTVDKNQKVSENSDQYWGLPTDTTPPAPPKGVEISSQDGVLTINWQLPEEPDFAYINIYRSVKAGQLGEQVASNLTGTSFQEEVAENVRYYYTLVAVDLSGNESSQKLSGPAEDRLNPFESF